MRLLHDQELPWESRSHLLGTAAVAMRRLLIDRAREHQALKRGGDLQRAEYDEATVVAADAASAELLALDEALDRLEQVDGQLARVVELRFFGGLELAEIGAVVGVTERTVKRDWTFARAWLARELGGRR